MIDKGPPPPLPLLLVIGADWLWLKILGVTFILMVCQVSTCNAESLEMFKTVGAQSIFFKYSAVVTLIMIEIWFMIRL